MRQILLSVRPIYQIAFRMEYVRSTPEMIRRFSTQKPRNLPWVKPFFMGPKREPPNSWEAC
jgi:hypothetical protein